MPTTHEQRVAIMTEMRNQLKNTTNLYCMSRAGFETVLAMAQDAAVMIASKEYELVMKDKVRIEEADEETYRTALIQAGWTPPGLTVPSASLEQLRNLGTKLTNETLEMAAEACEAGIAESDPGSYNNACRACAATIRARKLPMPT